MTDLNKIFNNFIDEIDNETVIDDYNIPLDTYLVFLNSTGIEGGFIMQNHNPQIFESHETAKSAASEIARQYPGCITSIFRVIENVGFMPYN